MVTTNQTVTSNVKSDKLPSTPRLVTWAAVALSLFVVLAYVLINAGILAIGDVPHEESSTPDSDILST